MAREYPKKTTNFVTKIAPNEDNLYICNKCDAGIYSKWDSLKHHILKKHEGYSYECSHCGQYFSSGEVRRKHINFVHTKVSLIFAQNMSMFFTRIKT